MGREKGRENERGVGLPGVEDPVGLSGRGKIAGGHEHVGLAVVHLPFDPHDWAAGSRSWKENELEDSLPKEGERGT